MPPSSPQHIQALVRCDSIRICLGAVRTPGQGSQEALGYILTILVSVSARKEFVSVLIKEQHVLLPILHYQSLCRDEEGTEGKNNLNDDMNNVVNDEDKTKEIHEERGNNITEIVSVLTHNLSLLSEFTASVALSPVLTEMYVTSLKALFKNDFSRNGKVRILALTSLVNFALNNRVARKWVLGGDLKIKGENGMINNEDLIEMIKETGYDSIDINLRFLSLLNIISLEESLCLKLLERGVHSVLVSIIHLLSSFNDNDRYCSEEKNNQKSGMKSLNASNDDFMRKESISISTQYKEQSDVIESEKEKEKEKEKEREKEREKEKGREKDRDNEDAVTVIEAVTQRLHRQASEVSWKGTRYNNRKLTINDPIKDSEEVVMDIAGAIIHNLSLKKAVIDHGILSCLLFFSKNCKSSRVLHSVRCLANISMHSKGKLALTKERFLVPILISCMRYGCAEAERVQHYGAQVICNVLASSVDRTIIEELILIGAITDLIVVALLRVNGYKIKESLCKILFNLLTRSEFRGQMIDLGVLSTIIELAKIESIEVLELCTRCVYNISCQTNIFAVQIRNMCIPSFLMIRAIGTDFTNRIDKHSNTSVGTISSPKRKIVLDSIGLSSSSTVKLLSGMGLANISYDKKIASLLCCEQGSNAIISIFKSNSLESSYCCSVILFNTSVLPECAIFSNSIELIPILMELIVLGPQINTQLAAASLLNFTKYPVFYDQVLYFPFLLFPFVSFLLYLRRPLLILLLFIMKTFIAPLFVAILI